MANDKLEDFILNHKEEFEADTPPDSLWGRIEASITPEDDEPDDFERFVANNREAFDSETPPPEMEAAIMGQLAEADATPASPLRVTHRRRYLPILGMAASALVLIVAAFLIGSSRGYQNAEQDRVALELERINPEYLETEQYYQREIASQFTRVKQVNNDPQLVADLKEIDAATAEIRASLLEVPESQRAELVEEMIRIYRTKLDILLRVQRQIPPGSPKAASKKANENEL
ncbi:anti-sigma factor [Lewinella sp. 4G2]|uniref:anti-sigma factor n=1 Tax=Lewinella sp. 4G2 TaxID=1803372 RepID=UPI0007B483BF|nr:anti-sigma factor [Lewinella sp. 4G2]OAV43464.1 hypothetical protein A3850_002665 [Lewinella sp. 4G2]